MYVQKHFMQLSTNCYLVRNNSAFVWTIKTAILASLCIHKAIVSKADKLLSKLYNYACTYTHKWLVPLLSRKSPLNNYNTRNPLYYVS